MSNMVKAPRAPLYNHRLACALLASIWLLMSVSVALAQSDDDFDQARETAAALFDACKEHKDPCRALELCQMARETLGDDLNETINKHTLELIEACRVQNEKPAEEAVVDQEIQAVQEQMAPEGFVRIGRASFLMGSRDETLKQSNERPHIILLSRGFLIQSTEVTQRQWREVTGEEPPSHFKQCGEECPVEQVTWYEAVAFTNAMSLRDSLPVCYLTEAGMPYKMADARRNVPPTWPEGISCGGWRLPTEAEWEYAARGGTTTATYKGDLEVFGANTAPFLDDIARYAGNSSVDYAGAFDCSSFPLSAVSAKGCGPRSVGAMEPNVFGLYDMLGNVWEWVWDEYGDYDLTVTEDPTAPSKGPQKKVEAPAEEMADPTADVASQGGGEVEEAEPTESAPLATGVRGTKIDPALPEAVNMAQGEPRVTRGCSWVSNARHCRAAFRGRSGPGDKRHNQGFRVARTLK